MKGEKDKGKGSINVAKF